MEKRKWHILLVVLVFFNLFQLFVYEPIKEVDRYTRYSVTSNIKIFYITLDGLENKLIENENYKTKEIEEIYSVVDEAQNYIYYTNRAVDELEILNDSFDIDMDGFQYFLEYLENKTRSGKRPTESDMQIIKSLITLKGKYSDATTLGNYNNKNGFMNKMEIPDNTNALFTEINEITKDFK